MAKKNNTAGGLQDYETFQASLDTSKLVTEPMQKSELSNLAKRIFDILTKRKIKAQYGLTAIKAADENAEQILAIQVGNAILPKTLIRFLLGKLAQTKTKDEKQVAVTPNKLLGALLKHDQFNVQKEGDRLIVLPDSDKTAATKANNDKAK